MNASIGRQGFVSTPTIVIASGGFAAALFGVYWDDAWHTDRGRDNLVSPPHLALYAGVAAAVAVVAWWGWRKREIGWRALSRSPFGIAVVGAAVTLGSAPVDEWWHQAFGRDAVLWSPPHLVALVGTVALGSGVALVAGASLPVDAGPASLVLLVAAAAGVVGGWQVLVLEYDTDVAQFSPLWYLPVLAAGLSAAALTVQAAVGSRLRWAAAWSGACYTLVMVVVIGGLWAADFSTPIVPAVIPALAAADVGRRRGWSVLARSAAVASMLFVVYVPYLQAVPGGVTPSAAQSVVGLAVAVVAVAATIVIFDPTVRWRPPLGPLTATAVLPLIAVIGLLAAQPAAAHDPGQGLEISDVGLIANVADRRVDIMVTFDGLGAEFDPVRIVARRAGRELTGPLTDDGERWSGRVDLDRDGRWFVYVEARRGDERLEAWLPVTAGTAETELKETALYVATDGERAKTAQLVAGVLLTVLALGLVARIAVTVRVARPPNWTSLPTNSRTAAKRHSGKQYRSADE